MTTLCIPVLELLIQVERRDEIKLYVRDRAVTVYRQIGVRDKGANVCCILHHINMKGRGRKITNDTTLRVVE